MTSMARIRELTAADLPAALEILDTCCRDARSFDRNFLESSIARRVVYVAEEESALAGIIYLLPEPAFADGGCIGLLVVHENRRGRGIGRQLVGFAERKVSRNAGIIYVAILDRNDAAQNFFSHLGYQRAGQLQTRKGGKSYWILCKRVKPVQARRSTPDTGRKRRKSLY